MTVSDGRFAHVRATSADGLAVRNRLGVGVDGAGRTPLNRLLEELSWEGNARGYRQGGRGRENVLVAEVFHLLDLLPRELFLGEVLRKSHGADAALLAAAAEAEAMQVDVLPGGPDLKPGEPNIQPDAYLHGIASTVLVEAKRLRTSSFQLDQLAREYVTLMRDHTTENRLLWLVLGSPPPVKVRGVAGRMSIHDAILERLPAVHAQATDPPPLDELEAGVDDRCAWITWRELSDIVQESATRFHSLPSTVTATIRRASEGIVEAVRWHA